MFLLKEDAEFLMMATNGKQLIVNTALLQSKQSKDTQGVQVMTLRGRHVVRDAKTDLSGVDCAKLRPRGYPSSGYILKQETEQIEF